MLALRAREPRPCLSSPIKIADNSQVCHWLRQCSALLALRARGAIAPYAELHCKTNFSFLEGASHPDELVARAAELGYSALAVTDRNSLAGVVRAWAAAKQARLEAAHRRGNHARRCAGRGACWPPIARPTAGWRG